MEQLRDSDLHDDFLRDLEETGVYDLAAAVGIVENGEIVNLKQHQGEWAPHANMPLLPPSAPAGLPQPLGYGFQQQRQQLGQLQLQSQPAQAQRLPQQALLPQAAGQGASLGRRLPLEAAGIDASELAAADAAVVACLQAAAEAALVVQMARAKLAQHAPHAAAATGAAQPAAGAAAAAGAGVAIRGLATGPPSETEAAAGRPQLRPRRGGAAVKLEDLDLLEDAAGAELEAAEPAGAKRKRVTRAGSAAAATAAASAAAAAQNQSLSITARVTGKGLRHFSLKLCEVVEKCGRTTYSQVADELVKEMLEEGAAGGAESAAAATPPDEKNIRRRVYDALNVLMAIGIIHKEKKEIVWSGWPEGLACNSAHLQESERGRTAARVEQKAKQLEDMLEQQSSLAGLILRNRGAPLDLLLLEAQQEGAQGGAPPPPNPLQLPFMLVQAPGGADVEVSVSEDSRLAELNFHSWPFQIFDDESVLRMMRMGAPPDQLLRAFGATTAGHAGGWGSSSSGGDGAGGSGAGGSGGLEQRVGSGVGGGIEAARQLQLQIQQQQQQAQQAQQAQQPAEQKQVQQVHSGPGAFGALGPPSTVPQLRPHFASAGWTGLGEQQQQQQQADVSSQQQQQLLLPLQQAAFPAQPMLRPALRPADTTPGAAASGSRRLPTPAAAAAAALLPPTPLSDLPWQSPGSAAGRPLPQLRQRQQGLDQLGAVEQGQGGQGLQTWGSAVPPNPFQDADRAPSRRQQRR